MKEVNKIVSRTKRTINLTMLGFIAISFFGIYLQLINDAFTNWSYVSIGLGLFIIYALLRGKDWAKLYITIACTLIVVFSLIPTISLFYNGNWIFAIPNLAIIIWSGFLIEFLNHGETYEQYTQIVNQGFDYSKEKVDNIESILEPKYLFDFNRKQFNSSSNYLSLTQKLLISEKMDIDIESIQLENNVIIISTADTNYQIEIDKDAIFFDKDFIPNMNSVLSKIESKYSVAIVYPDSLTNKRNSKIGIVSNDELINLTENAMLNQMA